MAGLPFFFFQRAEMVKEVKSRAQQVVMKIVGTADITRASAFTFIEVFGQLAGVSAAVGAALLHRRALGVLLAALHAGGRKAAGLLRGGAVALLHPLHRLQELAARQTLVVLFGKEWLEEEEEEEETHVRLVPNNTSANSWNGLLCYITALYPQHGAEVHL